MPKVIQMPRRSQPENQDRAIHRSTVLPDAFEESESLAKVQHWLEMGDAALQNPIADKKQTA